MNVADIAPWDQTPYYAQPRETQYAGNPFTQVLIARANAQRVSLVFAGSGSLSCIVTTVPTTAISTQGIILTTNTGIVTLTFDTHGPLVQSAWYLQRNTAFVTVYEIVINTWPLDPSHQSLIDQADAGAFRNVMVNGEGKPPPAKLFGNRWNRLRDYGQYSLDTIMAGG